MKTHFLFIVVTSLLLLGCNKDHSQTLLPKKTTVQVVAVRQYKYKIGEGVEIYNAKFKWVYEDRRVYSVATSRDSVPAVRYDDLIAYQLEPKYRRPLLVFTQPANTLLTMKPTQPIISDSGYVVTVDKTPIFNTLIVRGINGVDDKGVHLYFPKDFDYDLVLPTNTMVVDWDSVLRSTNPPTPRNLPDPRYDKRLIDRLKSDGKLVGF